MGFISRIIFIYLRLRLFFYTPKRSLYFKWQQTKTYKKKIKILNKVWGVFCLFFIIFPLPHLFLASLLFLSFISFAFIEPPDDFD